MRVPEYEEPMPESRAQAETRANPCGCAKDVWRVGVAVAVTLRPGPLFADVAGNWRSFRDLSAALHGRRQRRVVDDVAVTLAVSCCCFFLSLTVFVVGI